MANLQVRLNDDLKSQADALFASLGFDTSTAVRMFLTAAVEQNGLPFEVRHKSVSDGTLKAIADTHSRTNLNELYDTTAV